MNKHLQKLLQIIQQADNLNAEQKNSAIQSLKEADKELEITAFKLDKTEKIKHTTAVLLEETIAELEQKRKAVEAQNCELEIEAALEKVRSRSLAMHKSDELQEVVNAVFDRLKDLNIEMDSALIYIFKEGTKDVDHWIASPVQNRSAVFHVPEPDIDFVVVKDLWNAKESGKDFLNKSYSLEEKNEWFSYAFEHTDYKFLGEDRKKFILEAKAISLANSFSKNTGIQINRFYDKIFSAGAIDVLKRISKVFEQAYTRFLDLQKAEAQAREAQIEAALERIRSRAMAIRQSGELMEIIHTVFEEWKKIGLDLYECNINLLDRTTRVWTNWGTGVGEATLPKSYLLPSFDHPFLNQLYEDVLAGIPHRSFVLEGDDYHRFLRQLFAETDFKNSPKEYQDALWSIKKMFTTHAYMQYGSMDVVTQEPLPDATSDILKRFAKVFEQAYTRYLDVVQAEAQARESQIQLSLERVRARAMGMHKTEELSEVLSVLFEQFDVLGITPIYTFLSLIDLEKNSFTYRQTGRGGKRVVTQQTINLDASQIWKEVADRFKAALYDTVETMYTSKEQVAEVFEVYKETYDALPEGAKVFPEDFPDGIYTAAATSRFGHLGYDHSRPSTEEEKTILLRFNTEFTRLYQRFHDLQKAEAQAREAQIEAALEKVRSRSLAMQKSDELKEVITVVLEKLQELNIAMESRVAVIVVFKEGSRDFNQWVASPDFSTMYISTPYFEHLILSDFWNAKESGVDFYSKAYSTDEKNSYFKFFFEHSFYKNLIGIENEKNWIFEREFYAYSPAFEKNSSIGIADFSGKPLSEKEIEIIKRFAKVFEQTYTRFLDLQKAEAQAREAHIENALEKVRSRTMAMQKSDELPEAANNLFLQVQSLGIPAWSAGYCIWDEDKQGITLWMSSEGVMQPSAHVPLTRDSSFIHMKEAYERGNAFHVEEIVGEALVTHYQYMRTLPVVGDILDSIIATGHPLPTFQIFHCVYFSQGFLLFITYEPVPEAHEVFKRFGKVFEQTYTRFLDLQKAEAQTREAQVETSVERVRSQAMAMRSSEDLIHAAEVMRNEMIALNVEGFTGASFFLVDENDWVSMWDFSDPGNLGNPASRLARWNPKIYPMLGEFWRIWKEGTPYFVIEYGPDKLKQALDEWYEVDKNIYSVLKQAIETGQLSIQWNATGSLSRGVLSLDLLKPPTEDTKQIVMKMTAAFDLAYQRFEDLKQAEAQAREAKIENALEKVRSRSLAMHQSDELQDVINTVFDRMRDLEIEAHTAAIMISKKDSKDIELWIQNIGRNFSSSIIIPYNEKIQLCRDLFQWRENITDVPSKTYSKEEKDDYFHHLFSNSDLENIVPEDRKNFIFESNAYTASNAHTKNAGLSFARYSDKAFTADEHEILKRFAKVFDQAYVRFLDLQKAEAQARESQIEASLERVRAEAMIMRKPEELIGICEVLFHELVKLGFQEMRNTQVLVNNDEKKSFLNYDYSDYGVTGVTEVKYEERFENWIPTQFVLASSPRAVTENHFKVTEYAGKALEEFRATRLKAGYLPDPKLDKADEVFYYFYSIGPGSIGVSTFRSISSEQHEVLNRFRNVFALAYQRYSDIAKAEIQAREATIEAALEKVRGSAMAMHTSEDVVNATSILFLELHKLGIETMRCGILIIDEDQTMEVWTATRAKDGQPAKIIGKLDMTLHPLLDGLFHAWKNKEESYEYQLRGQDRINYYNTLASIPIYSSWSQFINDPDHSLSVFLFEEGGLYTFAINPFSDEIKSVMKRFTSVFSLTFRRYQDLKKAEEQAREATIEAALEKVRGKAMAMHTSNDLTTTAGVVFTELKRLGINSFRSGVGLLTKENRKAKLYSAISSDEGDTLSLSGTIMLDGHPLLSKIWDSIIDQSDYFPVLKGELLESYYSHISSAFNIPLTKSNYDEEFGCFLPFSGGGFYVWSDKPYTESEIKIIHRFKAIIDLTFRRYIELQRAEANALDAVRSASLDRVRAEIASMRSTADLAQITPLIWSELTTLGVPFVRCGLFIMDDEKKVIHNYLSTPDGKPISTSDGKSIAVIQFPFDTPGFFAKVLGHWQKKKILVDHLDKAAFSGIASIMVQHGAFATEEQYLSTLTHTDLHAHALPFLQGMLYVANTAPLAEDQIKLVQALADAFSTAYARYEDFNKLEAAKQQTEKTLVDLKLAQSQLIQSEKMASLGELTAGIAHEIQNPLNFVNNFSEVNTELLAEMKVELEKGNYEEVKALANDIIDNEQKINHHGKRAGGIVSGMLQHSRTSSGKREPTDINKLADEYLRLAFHGLRAKDKSFNSNMKTDFDETIGHINVVPQDMGRVILNLITNAFYVVNEKSKQNIPGYEPTVTVSTRRTLSGPVPQGGREGRGEVLISVKDNGNGIPQKILDKIFQPFFTTKPTGQGTGLGLSLAYDIVKAHGGELRVETKEARPDDPIGRGEGLPAGQAGSEFVIVLPV